MNGLASTHPLSRMSLIHRVLKRGECGLSSRLGSGAPESTEAGLPEHGHITCSLEPINELLVLGEVLDGRLDLVSNDLGEGATPDTPLSCERTFAVLLSRYLQPGKV